MEADLEVRVVANLLEEQAEDGVRLGLGNAHDSTCEPCVMYVSQQRVFPFKMVFDLPGLT